MIDWVVFGWTGSEWQLLLKRRQAALLGAAGPDIRETVFIFRPGRLALLPERGHQVADLALERRELRGRPVEAGQAAQDLASSAQAEGRLFQDTVRQHRLLPLARPGRPARAVHRLRDEERPQTRATAAAVRRRAGMPGIASP